MEKAHNTSQKELPLVVIVGRPNVGKSTLFNRLLHQRRAITDPTPGVTRDPVAADASLKGKRCRLVDTGGFKLEREGIDELVVRRTLETVEQADLILLVMDATEITAEDEEFIKFLRRYQERLLVVVNKTEGGRFEQNAWNIVSYGFDRIIMISAEHGDRIAELEELIAGRIAGTAPVPSETAAFAAPIRIAILGKPNTGKSTLSNLLSTSQASLVSPLPGTTRDVIAGAFSFKQHTFTILDTAGIRRKSKVTENIEYYSVNRAIKSIDTADIVFLVIDAVEGLSDQDKKIAALAHDKGRGIIMVLNKWDLMPTIKNTFQAVSDRIRFLFGKMDYAPLVAISAEQGTGINALLNTAISLYRQLTTRIETSRLNAALEQWLAEYPPPISPANRFKVRYAVQIAANPVVFRFFVSRPHAVSEAYRSYLRNKIRHDLGFSHIPVTVEIHSSH
ncbi:MAG: ribosome biogenesis GTPase Der [Spirochaetaceae bacterium]|jgi:GTP-binding protein|nr:ribosome biogenesis GTPase Der [Spirochaetaceae bacterium]